MKFLVLGDLHGSVPNIYYDSFDAILAPGDFCSDDVRKYMFQALREKLQNPGSKIKWYDFVGKGEARKMVKKSLSDGRNILKQLNSFDVPVYIVPGNLDWMKDKNSKWDFLKENHYKTLIRDLKNITDVHKKIINITDLQIIGYGLSTGPEYPQQKKELEKIKPKYLKKQKNKYEFLYRKIASLFETATRPVILLSHNVPFNTPIDKIINPESPRFNYHFGSLIVRQIIEKFQPLVCIGGHMHEDFGKCKIGETVCINTGFGPNVNIWLELKRNKIKKLEFRKEDKIR